MGFTDATLVNAAYRAAMANVPKDLRPVYKQIGDSFERGMLSIGKGLGEVFKQAGNVGAAIIEKNAEDDQDTSASKGWNQYTPTPDDTTSPPAVDGSSTDEKTEDIAVETHTNSYGQKVDWTPNSLDEQIKKLNKELRSVQFDFSMDKSERKAKIAEIKENRRNTYESAKSYQVSSDLLKEYTKPSNFVINPEKINEGNFLRALSNNGQQLEDGSYAVQGFTKDGNIIFAYKDKDGNAIKDAFGNPISVDQKNVQNLIVRANPKITKDFGDIAKSSFDVGKSGGTLSSYDKDALALTALQNVNTGADFEWAASRKVNGVSLFEDLYNNPLSKSSFKLFSALNIATFDVTGDDGKKDGKVDLKDFENNPDNFMKLKSALLNPTDPNFNLQNSKAFLGDFVKDRASIIQNQGSQKYVPSSDGAGTAKEKENTRFINTFVNTANEVAETGKDGEPINLGGGNFIKIIKDPNVDSEDPKGGLKIELTTTDSESEERTVRFISYQDAVDNLTQFTGLRAKDIFKGQSWYSAEASGFNSQSVLGNIGTNEDDVVPIVKNTLNKNYPGKFKVRSPIAFGDKIIIETKTDPPKRIKLDITSDDFNQNLDQFINENVK